MATADALCRAVKAGDIQQVNRLLDGGLNPSQPNELDGRTALHIAASDGDEQLARILLARGANANAHDRWDSTPLLDALRANHFAVARLLRAHGATPTAPSLVNAPEFAAALRHALPVLCASGAWDYAEVWLLSAPADASTLSTASCSHVWFAPANHAAKMLQFRTASEGLSMPVRDAIISKAVSTRKTLFLPTLEGMHPQRAEKAKEAGLKCGLAIPVAAPERNAQEPMAVITLLSLEQRTAPPADDLAELSFLADRLVLGPFVAASSESSALPTVTVADGTPRAPSPYEEQKKAVYALVVQEGVFQPTVVHAELEWFYGGLGLEDYYFRHFSPATIARHLHTLIAAKKLATVSGAGEEVRINYESKDEDFYMCPAQPTSTIVIDKRIESHFEGDASNLKRLTFFESRGPAIKGGTTHLALYFLEPAALPDASAPGAQDDISRLAGNAFLRSRGATVKDRYAELLARAARSLAPVIEVHQTREEGSSLLIALRRDAAPSYFVALSELLHFNNITSPKKFVEHFANGYVVFQFGFPTPPAELSDFLNQLSLMALVPQQVISPLLRSGHYSANEMTYNYVVWRFAYYFLKPQSEEYTMLAKALEADPVNRSRLIKLRRTMTKEFLAESRILEALLNYPDVMKQLYADFSGKFKPKDSPASGKRHMAPPTLTRVKTWRPTDGWDPKSIPQSIKGSAMSELDEQILSTFLLFNNSLQKTNFFRSNKSALSFRLDPSFLAQRDYPAVPFALIFVLGRDFRGFHVRFRDVARGGIRIVRSGSQQQHIRNKEFLFEENFGLAFTQQMKNKDIPEGGSKGTILPSFEMRANPEMCFKKYIDSLLDLLLPDASIVDYYKKEEILFCGPDEGTADLMDWAALHARERGARFWKAFTTGKSPRLGGIPHDTYGMTTRGVHQYVIGSLAKRNLPEDRVTKVQTGGPDGDLGSNEIKISKDRTIAVVDGSGVLYDPVGIDRPTLTGLAEKRKMVKEFDRTKLSPQGFLVLIEDKGVTLPDGTLVENGLPFRNEFHLNPLCKADMFVPCGGRPEAVNINNVSRLFDKDGQPRWKIIVEGANLFFTQDARLALEKAGAIVFKDAAANKGGVTSSSLEVLAALALSDEDFLRLMCVGADGTVPEFYQKYVVEVQTTIETNAKLEFECLWREGEETGIARSILSDKVSEKINELETLVSRSSLWANSAVRRRVLNEALPRLLVKQLGLDAILARVPEAYLRAIFGSFVAARYVYSAGLRASEFAFFEYMQRFTHSDDE